MYIIHLEKAVFCGLIAILFFLFFYKLLYCCSIAVVSIFSPLLHPNPAKPTSLPCFSLCVLHSSSWKPFSPLSPTLSPLAIVRLFLISMSLVLFCLFFSFVDYVPVKGEIIWYLSLTTWLISLCIPMFIAAQFTIAKYWKQPKCPSVNDWIKKLWYIYTMEYYVAERKKELIPSAKAWMELENIMLSEIS